MRDNVLLRMRATDAGFDREVPAENEWLRFRAGGNLASVWIAGDGHRHVVAAAPASVTVEVGVLYLVKPWDGPLPSGASAAWTCTGDAALDALCRRLAVLGHVLPDQPWRRVEQEVERILTEEGGERSTERVAAVRQRVGQAQFRDALERYWGGKCPLTGVGEPALLRASHTKPWADSDDRERLDVHNGFLLSALWDAAFDAGLVTITAEGVVRYSPRLGAADRRVLEQSLTTARLPIVEAQRNYLQWHHEFVFQA